MPGTLASTIGRFFKGLGEVLGVPSGEARGQVRLYSAAPVQQREHM